MSSAATASKNIFKFAKTQHSSNKHIQLAFTYTALCHLEIHMRMRHRLWWAIQISTSNPLIHLYEPQNCSILKEGFLLQTLLQYRWLISKAHRPWCITSWRNLPVINAEKIVLMLIFFSFFLFFFYTFLQRILIYLIQMAREIEVHEPLHSYNTGHVSEQCIRIPPKIVYSNKKKIYFKWNELMNKTHLQLMFVECTVWVRWSMSSL